VQAAAAAAAAAAAEAAARLPSAGTRQRLDQTISQHY
jgi:hypothetical protein